MSKKGPAAGKVAKDVDPAEVVEEEVSLQSLNAKFAKLNDLQDSRLVDQCHTDQSLAADNKAVEAQVTGLAKQFSGFEKDFSTFSRKVDSDSLAAARASSKLHDTLEEILKTIKDFKHTQTAVELLTEQAHKQALAQQHIDILAQQQIDILSQQKIDEIRQGSLEAHTHKIISAGGTSSTALDSPVPSNNTPGGSASSPSASLTANQLQVRKLLAEQAHKQALAQQQIDEIRHSSLQSSEEHMRRQFEVESLEASRSWTHHSSETRR